MRAWIRVVGPSLVSLVAAGCGDAAPDGYRWQLPAGFPQPRVPEDNPMSEAKVELGRHLFYDRRLSENQTQSCASCHKQSKAFTDGRMLGLGSTGEDHPRNALTLTNVAYVATYGWANPTLLELEQQAVVPMFGDDPVELGMHGLEEVLLERLRGEPRYRALFALSFPEEVDPFSVGSVVRALSSFERTLISGDSPYDRFTRGEAGALTESADRGRMLFNSDELGCFHCHGGFNFREDEFHNTGLYNFVGSGASPAPNSGLREWTGLESDTGRFRVPTLRNVARTRPYMHDGSIATLDEVLDHYAAGGRSVGSGPLVYKSARITGFELSVEERNDMIAFLESLTDATFLADPAFSNPWMDPCRLCPP